MSIAFTALNSIYAKYKYTTDALSCGQAVE